MRYGRAVKCKEGSLGLHGFVKQVGSKSGVKSEGLMEDERGDDLIFAK